ncbi:type 2 lantibiotic biosynthesis protein LanM [Enterococcus sp. PF1-24]|uniref:type 2 lanthipeptide synthetase LanM n=1 Tax=unclassified Enterococcus TaxID=2608891 RepID=UPI002475BB41|nr:MULTISPECIES: type 2 lanthipeptide synthetase LanM [unclassified Enterococcus]MDH6363683.1 type 2 lantibiotic biosynthesis protein LanM [Enterococcus sp. PFB1-1]MDH6400639.1 type 2 lantibiotic biosynthesis protein LanM [Enterococcus sp. PF1-24]
MMKNHNHLEYNKYGAFDEFFSPILSEAEKDLKKELIVLQNTYFFEMNIENIVFESINKIKEELVQLTVKTLIKEMNFEKPLQGANEWERYQFYVSKFRNEENIDKILNRYPILKLLIEKKINYHNKNVLIAIKRMILDICEIEKIFCNKINRIESVIFPSSDSHNFGKNILFFVVNDGFKIVYKPHSIETDEIYLRIVELINSDLKYKIRAPKIVSKKDYGYQEFISSVPGKSVSDADKFYYRLGAILGVFSVFNGTDIHSENLIACGSNPVVVDLETLFTNNSFDLNDEIINNFWMNIRQSVFGTMIIPLPIEESMIDIDLSATFSDGGQISKKIKNQKIINQNSDEMEVVSEFVVSNIDKNRFTIGKNIVNPLNYTDEILNGFLDCCHQIIKNKKILKNKFDSIKFENVKVRQVIKPTHIYGKLLTATQHPNYLNSENNYRKIFNFLKGTEQKTILEQKVAELEVASLYERDIPYFVCRYNSKDLETLSGEKIKGYFNKTIKEILRERLDMINDDFINLQKHYIELSFAATLKINKFNKLVTKNNDKHKLISIQDNLSFKDNANIIGEYFRKSAIWAKNETECTWITLNNEGENFFISPLSPTLYGGLGSVLFLFLLSKETNNLSQRKLAEASLKGLENIWGEKLQSLPCFSVFYGKPAFIYLYYNIYAMYGTQSAKDKFDILLEELFNDINQIDVTKSLDLDYIGGISGVIQMLCNIYEIEKNPLILSYAEKLGEILILRINYEKIETGLAHGFAGYYLAFNHLSMYKPAKFEQITNRIQCLEDKEFDSNILNWRDKREEELRVNDPQYWCYGAPGILLARSSNNAFFNVRYRDIIESIFAKYDANANNSLCHGNIGVVDILIEVAKRKRNEDIMKKCSIILTSTLKVISDKGILDGFEHGNGVIDDFMTGTSGLGYVLLRANNPNLPSILSLEVFHNS